MKALINTLFILLIPSMLFSFHNYKEEKNKNETSIFLKSINYAESKLSSIYNSLNKFSKSLDELLANEKSKYLYKDSYIHIQHQYDFFNNKKYQSHTDISLKIKLPQFKKKVKLLFNNDDNKVLSQDINNNVIDNNETIKYKNNDYNLAMQYEKYKEAFNIKAKIGVKVSSNPYIFTQIQAQKTYELHYLWYLVLKRS